MDTKKVTDKSGVEKEYRFEVIGNPCESNPAVCEEGQHEGCIPSEAPAVKCDQGKLAKAVESDGGHVIIGMYYDEVGDGAQAGDTAQPGPDGEQVTLNDMCDKRSRSGSQSGMGTIFIQVAKLNPIQ